jgi:hypothetical protein
LSYSSASNKGNRETRLEQSQAVFEPLITLFHWRAFRTLHNSGRFDQSFGFEFLSIASTCFHHTTLTQHHNRNTNVSSNTAFQQQTPPNYPRPVPTMVSSNYFLTALMATTSMAHMVMKTPKPWGNPNNSPLAADGSDFPCKAIPADRSTVQNIMAIGEPQTLSFTGSAVHGGGSCQVSLTSDLNPTASSKWMVIKSIEGGCPASVAGNLPADPNGSGASTFQYTIPEGIAPGEYTIAWTWHNKIGNREMYMNCGPATVTGAKKKRYAPAGVSLVRRQSSFPDMFIANLAKINSCTTPESFDYNYPNPGADVQSAGTGPYTKLSCGQAGNNAAPQPTGAAGGLGSGTGSGSGAAATTTGAAQPTGQGSAPPAGSASSPSAGTGSNGTGQGAAGSIPGAGAPGNGGNGQGGRPGGPGVFATGAAPLPTEVAGGAAAGVAAPTGAAAPSGTGAAVPQGTGSSTGSTGSTGASTGSTAGAQTGACTDEGVWTCIGGTSYQRCASGRWTPVMPMATGMQCTPGTSATFAMSRVGR